MLSRTNSVIWMDDETENQTNNNRIEQNHEINPNPTFKSMFEIEEENNNNWFLQSQNNFFSVDSISSSSCSPNSAFQNVDPNPVHYLFSSKPVISPTLNPVSNNLVNETFEVGCGSGFGPDVQSGCCDVGGPNLLQLAGNGSAFPFLENVLAGTPFILNGPPTLFQKRAALCRNLSDFDGAAVHGGGGGQNEKISGGSWDDVDNLSFDGSSLNYDSDEFTLNGNDFEESGVKIGGGNSFIANSSVTAAVGGRNQKGKKKGQPAKNLMAERRRRKKLNDRLYMLRSVVPKISKMDRASILGDAIEYLKELLQKINDLNHELEATPSSSLLTPTAATNGFYPPTPTPTGLHSRIKDELCPTAIPSPTGQPATVEVRLREGRAVNIHMFCSRRPGLLLSTTRALDDLGLDIQQAVISCFNGFALDVFRAEQCKEGRDVHPDEVRAVLLESAGYHGVA